MNPYPLLWPTAFNSSWPRLTATSRQRMAASHWLARSLKSSIGCSCSEDCEARSLFEVTCDLSEADTDALGFDEDYDLSEDSEDEDEA